MVRMYTGSIHQTEFTFLHKLKSVSYLGTIFDVSARTPTGSDLCKGQMSVGRRVGKYPTHFKRYFLFLV